MSQEHLPVFGIGPIIVFPMILISVLSVILSYFNMIPIFQISELNSLFLILGCIIIIAGIILWALAVIKSKITQEILDGHLVTEGVYSYVRHPIYSAFLFVSIGLILTSQNVLLFIFPIIYWLILTIAMIKTEEKWLKDKFGDEYEEYSNKVNRFFPSFKKI